MKTLSVGDFKAHFSDVIKLIQKGEIIAVTFGKSKKVIGYFGANPGKQEKKKRRKLGILQDKIEYQFNEGWYMSDEELIGDATVSS
jgi:hypothetical protein